VHLLVRVNVNVPDRDCSTTVGLFTHLPTSPLTNTRAENSCSLAWFISYVERARSCFRVRARAGARSRPDIIKKHPLKTSRTLFL
jgi:hypothetical protein